MVVSQDELLKASNRKHLIDQSKSHDWLIRSWEALSSSLVPGGRRIRNRVNQLMTTEKSLQREFCPGPRLANFFCKKTGQMIFGGVGHTVSPDDATRLL